MFLAVVIPLVKLAECFLQFVILLMMFKHWCPGNLFAEYVAKTDDQVLVIFVHLKPPNVVQKCKHQVALHHNTASKIDMMLLTLCMQHEMHCSVCVDKL